jgi:hypothetical protein
MSAVTAKSTVPRRKARAKAKRRIRVPEAISKRAVSFVAILGMTYLASSLSGNVMVEKARQEAIKASQKALDAKKVEAELSKRLDQMTGFNAIGQWAETHNLKSVEELAALKAGVAPTKQSGEVALNEKPAASSDKAVLRSHSVTTDATRTSQTPDSGAANPASSASFAPSFSSSKIDDPSLSSAEKRGRKHSKRHHSQATVTEGEDGTPR